MNRTGGENVVRQKLGILSCTILAATMHYVDMLPIVVIFRLVEVDSENDVVDKTISIYFHKNISHIPLSCRSEGALLAVSQSEVQLGLDVFQEITSIKGFPW